MKFNHKNRIAYFSVFSIMLTLLIIFSSAASNSISMESQLIDTTLYNTSYLEMRGTVRESKISDVETIKPIDSALITITGFCYQQIYTNKKGKCSFRLPLNKPYKIEISKKGFVTKILEVNTKAPSSNINYGFSFDIDMLENINRLDVSVLKKPIAKVRYDNVKEHFEYDEGYTSRINFELKKMYKNYYALQKIQDFKNNSTPAQPVKTDSVSVNSTKVSTLPERFRKFDLDVSSRISHAEAVNVIDSFFSGNTKIKLEDIIDLIDFYFEQ